MFKAEKYSVFSLTSPGFCSTSNSIIEKNVNHSEISMDDM
jgi:hypothetical protein